MKSLMTNLKHNPLQNDPNDRVNSKDPFIPENCYSFGDHDYNTLR